MQVKQFSSPEEYWKASYPLVKNDLAKSSLFIGLCNMFRTNARGCVYQSLLLDEVGSPIAALIASKNKTENNIIASPISNEDYARTLYLHYIDAGFKADAFVGDKETANIFKSVIRKTGKEPKTRMVQGIYRCRKAIVPKASDSAVFRLATEKDINVISQYVSDFTKEAIPNDPPVDSKTLAAAKIDAGLVYVLEINDDVVSMAGKSRETDQTCSLNLVFTPKKLRGKGYASLVTAKLTELLLDSGKLETNLYTDMSNPTSNKIYQNVGYEFVCDSLHFQII